MSIITCENSPWSKLHRGERRVATYSQDMDHRFSLLIVWEPGSGDWQPTRPIIQFVGLNPSTADHLKNDPTVAKLCRFAKRWGYPGMLMTNIFSYRSTDPKGMLCQDIPVIVEENNRALTGVGLPTIAKVVCCWGAHGKHKQQGFIVTGTLRNHYPDERCGTHIEAFVLNKDGEPKHPLYLPDNSETHPLSLLELERSLV